VAACLTSVRQYEDRRQRENVENRNEAFEEYRRQRNAAREERRRLAEEAHEQERLEQQKREKDHAFENYERRLKGIPEQEREVSTTEGVYIRAKEGKELKDYLEGAWKAFKYTGEGIGGEVVDGLSPGLPPYTEAGSAFVDEDWKRAKAIDEKVRKEKRESERWLQEAERQEKELNPYYPLPWPPPHDRPEIKAAP